jgi:SP family xylose:H+ symportor-like MFS transporter
VLQQWSGINSIFNYAEEIYRSAGYGIGDIMFNIVITGTINLVFTLVAIAMVDRVGRRTLMLVGCAAIGVSHVLLGGAYAAGLKGLPVLVFTLCSLGAYALSLAPVTWVLIAEIFPNRVRGAAVSVAVSALWVACFILTFAFPLLQRTAGNQGPQPRADRAGPAAVGVPTPQSDQAPLIWSVTSSLSGRRGWWILSSPRASKRLCLPRESPFLSQLLC